MIRTMKIEITYPADSVLQQRLIDCARGPNKSEDWKENFERLSGMALEIEKEREVGCHNLRECKLRLRNERLRSSIIIAILAIVIALK